MPVGPTTAEAEYDQYLLSEDRDPDHDVDTAGVAVNPLTGPCYTTPRSALPDRPPGVRDEMGAPTEASPR